MPHLSVKLNKREIATDYLLSILLELIGLAALMFFCALFIYKGSLIGEEQLVGNEMSSPTVGRLIYLFLSFFLGLALGVAAHRYEKKNKTRISFWCGFCSGIFLWQAVGEEAWHFSVNGIHFVQLESISAFPLVILFVLMIAYGYRFHSFDWGIWCTIISFACNWLGHYVTIGIYPFVAGLIESHGWNVYSGSICGGVMLAVSIRYLLRHGDTLKGRLFASLLTFIAIGIVSLSIIDG